LPIGDGRRPRARLKEVAAATGFSANTVSLALRGSPRIPEPTRALILRAAEQLNYLPNQIARSLASRATRAIGLVMTDIMNPTLTLAARSIERELSAAGYGMMFAASDSRLDNEKKALALFQSYQIDGILIYPADHGELGHIRAVSEAGYAVLLLAQLPGDGLEVVAIDDRAGGYKAARHLLGKGHRRIVMLDGGRLLNNSAKIEGVRHAIQDAGLAADAVQAINPRGHSPADGFAAMGEAARLEPLPTAVFASTDSLALGALRWCRDHGLAVPDDIAIVGYDNTEIAAFCEIPLTTVNYAADEVSRLSVQRLIAKIANPAERAASVPRLIEPELIIRRSA
jgi:LacI family transcriptional regulator